MSLSSFQPPPGSDLIRLGRVQVPCVIGNHSHERVRTQLVGLELALAFDARAAAKSGALAQTIDYEKVVEELRWVLQKGRFHLLESAAEALARLLLAAAPADAPSARATAVCVELSKLEALDGRALPSLRVSRQQGEVTVDKETRRFGALEVLFDGARLRLERLTLAPGASAPGVVPSGRVSRLRATSPGLLVDGASLAPEAEVTGGFEVHNPTPVDRSLLVLDVPTA